MPLAPPPHARHASLRGIVSDRGSAPPTAVEEGADRPSAPPSVAVAAAPRALPSFPPSRQFLTNGLLGVPPAHLATAILGTILSTFQTGQTLTYV